MDRPFAVIGRALRDYWDEAFNLMLCNLIWFFAQLLVIPGPPATAALFFVTNRVAHGGFARLPDYWEGFKRHFWDGWKWGALNIVVILVLGYAVLFYSVSDFPAGLGFVLMSLNVALLAIWLLTQLFAFPFWLEQEDKRFKVALRNSLVIQAQNVRLMLIVVVLVAVMAAATRLLPPLGILVCVALLTMLGNTVVVTKLDELAEREKAAG